MTDDNKPDGEQFQLFPSLDEATETAVRESIERHGMIDPVTVDQHGRILDGHHRHRIATELGLDCPTFIVNVRDDDDARDIAERLNLARRGWSVEERRRLVADLRARGQSTRAIAEQVGVSKDTVHRDLSGVSPETPDNGPAVVKGRDGKTYPSRRPEPGDLIVDDDQQPHLIDHVEPLDDENADLVVDTDENYTVIPRNDTPPPNPVRKPDIGAGQGVSHPARFSAGMTDLFADLINRHVTLPAGENIVFVVDPFAGTGGIHELATEHIFTYGVEIEPEWADLHPETMLGSALNLSFFETETIDVVCTSPTYGNRLADSHNASDPERRRSYTHDLGRPLTGDNSGAMQWGDEYRAFHDTAWAEATRVLRPRGIAIINIKDHIRKGERQAVSAWHAQWFLTHGFEFVDCVPFAGRNLNAGANAWQRVDAELVWVFRK